MKNSKMLAIVVLALGLMVCSAKVSEATPMGTAFTYQGRLIDANSAADGLYDFEFKLFDDANTVTGNQLGSTIDVNEVTVNDGYFTAKLGFGTEVFDGNDVWLQIAVRPGKSTDAYTILTPRQQITPTPYAQYALNSPDSDTLAQLGCEPNQVPKWNGTMWVCGEDNVGSDPWPDIGTWRVTRYIDRDQVFKGVVEQVAAGKLVDGSLVYLNDNGEEARRIDFFGVVPVSFEMVNIAPVPTPEFFGKLETLTFMVSRVELGLSTTTPPSSIYQNNFIFYLNGEAVDGVRLVVPGPIFFDSPEPGPIDFIPETPAFSQEAPSSFDFTFDLVAGGDRDPGWEAIYGGEMQFLKIDKGLEITFSEVQLSGWMDNTIERKEMVDWLNEWLRGSGTAANSTVEILDDGGLVLRMHYQNVVPVSYRPPAVSVGGGLIKEILVLRAGIINAH